MGFAARKQAISSQSPAKVGRVFVEILCIGSIDFAASRTILLEGFEDGWIDIWMQPD